MRSSAVQNDRNAGTEVVTAIDGALRGQVDAYLAEVMADMIPSPDHPGALPVAANAAPASEIFSLLTSRAFCYLGRKNVEPYRNDVMASLCSRMATGEPFRFFYDIGPGYHATTRPGILPLKFDVGLSELFILFQVNALCRQVEKIYQPGAHFFLVIDNLCALRTNDIQLELTQGFVRQLRQLIEATRMSNRVDVVVESEEFGLDEYDRLLAGIEVRPPVEEPSPEAVDNVARFLGQACTTAEAAARIELYRRTGSVTNQLIDRLVREVHMTQRATRATLGFRPFPGGAQRTQVGELMLTQRPDGRIIPVLVTSRNVDAYDCVRLDTSSSLPAPITHVTLALPRPVDEKAGLDEIAVQPICELAAH